MKKFMLLFLVAFSISSYGNELPNCDSVGQVEVQGELMEMTFIDKRLPKEGFDESSFKPSTIVLISSPPFCSFNGTPQNIIQVEGDRAELNLHLKRKVMMSGWVHVTNDSNHKTPVWFDVNKITSKL